MGTHAVESKWGLRKVVPYAFYVLKSPAFRERFGNNRGKWLVETKSKRRMNHLIEETSKRAPRTNQLFLFTTFDQVKIGDVLKAPIWSRVGEDDPVALVDVGSDFITG